MNREAFLQALIDNVASHLESTVASGARHESDKDELRNLLLDIDAVDPSKESLQEWCTETNENDPPVLRQLVDERIRI